MLARAVVLSATTTGRDGWTYLIRGSDVGRSCLSGGSVCAHIVDTIN